MIGVTPENYWSGPFTKTGKSALVPKGPWIYAFTGIGVRYKSDPLTLADIVPRPLKVSEGAVFAYIVEIVAWSRNAVEFATEAPDQLYYHEGALFVKVEHGDKTFLYCPFMWVDTDISLLRGLLAGWPKKLAKIALTKLHPMLPDLDKPRKGLRLGGYVARAGSTLYKIRVEIQSDEEMSTIPLLTEYPFILPRYFAGIAPGMTTINELVEFVGDVQVKAWRGIGEIEILGGINDELKGLKPLSEVDGYYFYMLLKPKSISVVGKVEGFY